MSKRGKLSAAAVLAIDPAEYAGVAAVESDAVTYSAPAKGDRWVTLAPAVAAAVRSLSCHPDQILCVIEEGWLARRSMKGTMTLARRRGIAQAAAEAAGIQAFEFISPSTWQHALFPKGWQAQEDTTSKLWSVKFAQQYCPRVVDDNEADAICLAVYGFNQYIRLGKR